MLPAELFKLDYTMKKKQVFQSLIVLFTLVLLLNCTSQSALLNKTKRNVLFTLGNNYVGVNNYSGGLAAYLELVKNNPHDSKAITNIGYISNSAGYHKIALGCYKKALHYSHSQDIPLLNNIAITYAVLGDSQSALHILQKVKKVKTPYSAILQKTYDRIALYQNEVKQVNNQQEKINALQQRLAKELIPQYPLPVISKKLIKKIRAFCHSS